MKSGASLRRGARTRADVVRPSITDSRMYEQYFGLSGRPFATTPDPDFYFESRGHRRALTYLLDGTSGGESFMVMTGDIGAGKTMLVHKLLRELDPSVASALLVSTQLDAKQLLRTMLRGFGVPASGQSLDESQAELQAHLTKLAAAGRRALVVIDEAQNLLPDAIDYLSELASQQEQSSSHLQVLLVGQPELRMLLQRNPGRALRAPVFLFCDVGRLTPPETRAYIEHRLRRVGWKGAPSFADDAYGRIRRATDGVPRRINRLCDRLLLATYLGAEKAISPELVDQVDAELRAEMGEGLAAPAPAPAPAPTTAVKARASDLTPGLDHAAAANADRHAARIPDGIIPTLRALASIPNEATEAARPRADQAPAHVPVPAVDAARARAVGTGPRWAWAAAAALGLAVGGFAGWWASRGEREPPRAEAPTAAPVPPHRAAAGASSLAGGSTLAGARTVTPPAEEALPPTGSVPAGAQRTPPPVTPAAAPIMPTSPPVPTTAPPAVDDVPAPPPVAGPCTAAVAALGLCSPSPRQP